MRDTTTDFERRTFLKLSAATAFLSGTSVPSVSAASDDGWRSYASDARNTGSADEVGPTDDVSRDLHFGTDGRVSSGAVTDGDTVYFGSEDGYLYAVDPVTGDQEWEFDAFTDVTSEPATDGDTVYFSSENYTYAVSGGSEEWSHSEGVGPASPATVALGTVYVAKSRQVFALDADDGDELWSYRLGADSTAAPAFDEDNSRVYAAGDGELVALSAGTGDEIWTYRIDVDGAPAVDDDGVVYVAGRDGTVAAVDGGDVVHETTLNERFGSSPALAHGRVYVGSLDGGVYALEADDDGFSTVWNVSSTAGVNGSVAVAGDAVYVAEGSRLRCLDAETGDEIWEETADNNLYSPSVDGDTVYVGGGDDNLHGFSGEAVAVGADIEITSVELDEGEVGAGEEFSVTVEVENHGSASGEVELEMTRDGDFAARETVEVGGGGTEEVTVSASAASVVTGDFDIAVNGVSAGTLSIVEEEDDEEDEEDEEEDDEEAEAEDDEGADNETETDDGTGNETDPEEDLEPLPGFGFVAGAVGVAGALAARLYGGGNNGKDE